MSRPITMTDLCELSGYTRHQMRGFLGELPMYGKRKGNARVAIEYSTHDLLIVTMCCRLETLYGIRRQTVCSFAEGIARILGGPDRVIRSGRLILKYDPIQVDYVDQLGPQISDGIVVALEPVITLIERHLTPADTPVPKHQMEMNYGLLEVKSGRKGQA